MARESNRYALMKGHVIALFNLTFETVQFVGQATDAIQPELPNFESGMKFYRCP